MNFRFHVRDVNHAGGIERIKVSCLAVAVWVCTSGLVGPCHHGMWCEANVACRLQWHKICMRDSWG